MNHLCEDMKEISKLEDCDKMAEALPPIIQKFNYYINSNVVDLISGDDMEFTNAYKCNRDLLNEISHGACKDNSKVSAALSTVAEGVF